MWKNYYQTDIITLSKKKFTKPKFKNESTFVFVWNCCQEHDEIHQPILVDSTRYTHRPLVQCVNEWQKNEKEIITVLDKGDAQFSQDRLKDIKIKHILNKMRPTFKENDQK